MILRSEVFSEFWRHFDDPASSWRDGGPALEKLTEMPPDDRTETERMLLERLSRGVSDSWIAAGLGALRSQAAVPALTKIAFGRGAGPMRVAAAHALWLICSDERAIDVLIQILSKRRLLSRVFRFLFDHSRIDAAVALGDIDTPRSRSALLAACDDPDAHVRHNAEVALRRLNGESMLEILKGMAEKAGKKVTIVPG